MQVWSHLLQAMAAEGEKNALGLAVANAKDWIARHESSRVWSPVALKVITWCADFLYETLILVVRNELFGDLSDQLARARLNQLNFTTDWLREEGLGRTLAAILDPA